MEARSEWATADGTRYTAPPEKVAALMGAPDIPLEPHSPADHPHTAHGTQVLLRKTASGVYQLLFNGRQVTPNEAGEYVLPKFTRDATIVEDATGRRVPAPLFVAALAEVGAAKADSIRIRTVQRTYVGGVQLNADSEPTLSEAKVPLFVPGSVSANALAIAYPLALGPSAAIVIRDNVRARTAARKASERWWKKAERAVPSTLMDPLKSAMKRGGPGLALLAAGIQSAMTFLGSRSGEQASLTAAAVVAWTTLRSMYSLVSRGRGSISDEDASRDVEIGLFDLPAILKRVGGLTNNSNTNNGQPWTQRDLRAAKRFDDLFLLEYLSHATGFSDEFIQTRCDELEDELRGMGTDDGDIADAREQLKKDLRAINLEIKGEQNPSVLVLDNIDLEYMKRQSCVQTAFRVEIVDARRDSETIRESFTIVSDSSFEAGLCASGYVELLETIIETRQLLATTLHTSVDHRTSLLLNPHQLPTGNLKKDLVRYLAGSMNTTSMRTVVEQLRSLLNGTLEKLTALIDAALPLPTATTTATGGGIMQRALPHVLRFRNAAGVTFALERYNEGVMSVLANEPSIRSSDGLRDAVSAANTTCSIVRRAIDQFLEMDGATQARTRLLMRVRDPKGIASATGALAKVPSSMRTGRIGTRLVYAPRMPSAVVDALVVREEHPRIDERLRMEWVRGAAARTATLKALGLPETHTGELLAGVLAELAVEDIVERSSDAMGPKRWQLAGTALNAALARLRRATRILEAAHRHSPASRLSDDDALFHCHEGGEEALRTLRESAIWRAWVPPPPPPFSARRLDRFAAQGATAATTPLGVSALEEITAAVRGLVNTSDCDPTEFPYLSVQTLCAPTPQRLCVASDQARRRAWMGIASQLDHAHRAARRVLALAEGLRLDSANTDAVAEESAFARPILEVLLRSSIPAQYQPLDDLFGAPTQPTTSPVQPASTPSTVDAKRLVPNTTLAGAEFLAMRLANMRLDVADLADQRTLEPASEDARLVERFSAMLVSPAAPSASAVSTATPAEFIAPFAGALLRAIAPQLSHAALEEFPVYTKLLADGATDANTNRDPSSALRVVARAAVGPLHPFVVEWTGADVGVVATRPRAVDVPQPPQGPQRPPLRPHSLRADAENARASSERGCTGLAVDAASSLLFNVERLVQAGLVLASLPGPVAVSTGAPSFMALPPPAPTVRKRPNPDRVDRSVLNDISRYWMVVAVSLQGSDESGESGLLQLDRIVGRSDADSAAQQAALRAVASNDGQAYLAQLMKGFEPDQGERLKQLARKAIFINHRKVQESVEQIARNLMGESSGADMPDKLDATKATIPVAGESDDEATRKTKLRISAFWSFDTARGYAMSDVLRKCTERRRALRRIWRDNAQERLTEERERARELFLWHPTVAMANAVLRSLLTHPPTLVAPDVGGTGDTTFANAVNACVGNGLKVVPLGELVAVVARMPGGAVAGGADVDGRGEGEGEEEGEEMDSDDEDCR